MNNFFLTGTFIREEKNRFLCIVMINGIEEECYIPSSCRLENFISLNGKTVLLRKNKGTKGRTHYSVFAIKYRNYYLMLRPAEANDIVFNALYNKRFNFVDCLSGIEKEYTVNNYKADFYLPLSRQIIEVKSIITINKNAKFPTVYSERAIVQLERIRDLLNKGYEVFYLFVSLNPNVKNVSVSKDGYNSEYYDLFLQCLNNGMICKAFTAELKDEKSYIKKEIPISFD